MSTFQGLETARKALFAQQGALYTTGHNIANVNTEGYSRQRVNFETTTPFPVPSRVQPQIAGQLGTGVEIGTVQRIRDQFLDAQFRAENSKLGYWETKQEALSRMEVLLNEPSDNGLSKTMDLFWQSLQDLAGDPENSGARSVVAERGLGLAETFNHLSKSLQAIQADLKEQMDVSVKDINSLLTQINNLNEQIQKTEPHGFVPNDLYDDRDRLIDQLSQHMNIKVHYDKSSESANASALAEGLVSIEILDSTGNSFGTTDEDKIFLLEATSDEPINALEIHYDDKTGLVKGLSIGESGVEDNLELLQSIGSLNALIEAHGYVDGGEITGDYPEMLQALNTLAAEFAEAFNEVHGEGMDLNGKKGDNAHALLQVIDDSIDDLTNTSARKFLIELIGNLGVKGQQANSMKDSTEILQTQVEHSRMSVSAVSLDEEISNLIKFQHAYNAAARNMTAIDELIDRIINHMGLVGR